MRNTTHVAAAASLAAALLVHAASFAEEPAGVVAGWNSEDGLVLLEALNCAGCHDAGESAEELLEKQPPHLGDAGARITPQYLRAFLADPHGTKPGTTMPDLLHGLDDAERTAIVEALVHFLVSRGGPIDQRSSGSSLSQIERGKDLYHSVGCVACHAPQEPPPAHKIDPDAPVFAREAAGDSATARPSVPHGDLAMKTTVDVLADFLHDPLRVRPSGWMPAMNLQPGEARMIAAWLLRDQYSDKDTAPGAGLDVAYYEGNWQQVPDFEQLSPRIETESKGFDLSELRMEDGKPPQSNFAVRFQGLLDVPSAGTYRFWLKSDDGSVMYIDGSKVVDNDGIHAPQEKDGQIELARGRHAIEVGLVQGGGGYELTVNWQPPGTGKRAAIPPGLLLHSAAAMIPKGIVDFRVDPAQAERGKKHFAALGCASCHRVDAPEAGEAIASAVRAQPLHKLDPAAADGCLGERVAMGRPKFSLTGEQREAVRESLTELQRARPSPSIAEKLDHAMTARSCYACHRRGEKGGPDADRSDYFTYEVVVDLGDEGRLPPPLDGAGAKLTSAGLDDMLFDGVRYRTQMATRMPQFGKENIGRLPELLAGADAGQLPPHEPEFSGRLVDDGRRLAGKDALSCFNCHAWGELRLPGAAGLDLLQTRRRIRPEWFHAWLLDPQQLRPGTRMPTSWPQGKSFFPEIQDGDVSRQIDAVWAYLSAGEKGGIPPGLSPNDKSLLAPMDEPIVFRTFLDGVSAHAILVGFRQRTHVAFDANRVRMVLAWTGDFISTQPSWDGRAGQYAAIPANDIVRFPDGPPLARLDSLDGAWPEDVPKASKGSDRTPDGWRFRGYRYDETRTPTFLYSVEGIQVEETPKAELAADGAVVRRKLRLTTKETMDNLYLRVAAGERIAEDGAAFVVDGKAAYRITSTPAAKPAIRRSASLQELIVPIEFAPSSNDGEREAEIEIELRW